MERHLGEGSMSHVIDDCAAADVATPPVAAPGLRVGMTADAAQGPSRIDSPVSIRVEVEEAAGPLRLSVYLDGDLVETCRPASTVLELVLPAVRGRHVVTARAIDATGRWGGASVLVHAA
jgi:hypothetical protein